jgi:hypothetical protein
LAVADDGYRNVLGENNKPIEGSPHTAEDFDLPSSPDEIFGKYELSAFGFFETPPDFLYKKDCDENCECNGDVLCNGECDDCETIKYKNDTYLTASGGIADLYKTNLGILFFVPLALIIMIGFSLLKLSQRVVNIVFLYLVMPISISSMPLDDGARFATWRESMISNTLSVFGTVLTFNLFFMFIPFISTFKIPNASSFFNTIFVIIFILGVALAVQASRGMLASILGISTAQSGTLKELAKSITSKASGVSSAAQAVKRSLVGGGNSSSGVSNSVGAHASGHSSNNSSGNGPSHRFGGLLGHAVSAGKTGLKFALKSGKAGLSVGKSVGRSVTKAIDAGGRLLGGNAYTRGKKKMQNFISKTKSSIGNSIEKRAQTRALNKDNKNTKKTLKRETRAENSARRRENLMNDNGVIGRIAKNAGSIAHKIKNYRKK